MKRFFTICFLFLAGTGLQAQQSPGNSNPEQESLKKARSVENNLETETLSSPAMDVKSPGYYRSEADDFNTQAKKSPGSAQAWLNLYKSSLYSYYNGSVKVLTAQQKQELNDIVAEMKTKVPGSFEYNIAVYINGQHNTALLPHLAKAEEMNGNSLDVVEQFVAYYAITGNSNKCREYAIKHKKIAGYEAFIDEYAFNLLQSVEDNSVLFTHGVMDTYPLYNQQLGQKVRTGVEVINIDYLSSEEYRTTLGKRLGVTVSNTGNNYAIAFDLASKLKNSHPVYFSNAFAKTELKKHAAELELCGLAMKYGSNKTNGTLLEKKWKNFKVQHLEKADMKDDYSRKMSANYEPALIALHKYYSDAGMTTEAEKVKNIALKIAKVNGTEKQVAALLH